jgi:hypothetical protein
MSEPQLNPPCPWLPPVVEIHDFTHTRRHGWERGAAFYRDALEYAQSQWLCGKPAQAILQLNKAWMTDLDSQPEVLTGHPPPYRALVWMLQQCLITDSGFFGNPPRHFQHLATRMKGPRAEIRTWRAWLCMHLSARILPNNQFPKDGRQIAREGIWIPSLRRSLETVKTHGWTGEYKEAECALSDIGA